MKTAFALYDGFSVLNFAALFEAFVQQPISDFSWDLCAPVTDVYASQGIHFYPTCVTSSLANYDLIIVPGGPGALERVVEQGSFLSWLATAPHEAWLAACGEGVLLLAAAGLARQRRVASLPELADPIASYQALPDAAACVCHQPLLTASTPVAALELGRMLTELNPIQQYVRRINVPHTVGIIPVTGGLNDETQPAAPIRHASIERRSAETQVEIRLNVDGSGQHQVDTGLPFLDHMLTQVAVHGLFDLFVRASGDLQIDPHHTVEDTALAIGSAFQQALGDRAGIVRMASADCPMDESLAWAAVDFSGRPYSVIHADWHAPVVGGLPSSLIAHFLESFALQARCNLHAAVRYGRDDHHMAEALFKALGRALCAATRIDPRRAGQVPSSKGILF